MVFLCLPEGMPCADFMILEVASAFGHPAGLPPSFAVIRFLGQEEHVMSMGIIWPWVKTKRSPNMKIAGIFGCELPTNIDNNRF